MFFLHRITFFFHKSFLMHIEACPKQIKSSRLLKYRKTARLFLLANYSYLNMMYKLKTTFTLCFYFLCFDHCCWFIIHLESTHQSMCYTKIIIFIPKLNIIIINFSKKKYLQINIEMLFSSFLDCENIPPENH